MIRENQQDRTLRRRKLLKDVRNIILPITLQNLIGAAVNTADVVMLGLLSQTALSASSLANQITLILLMFFTGLSSGTVIMASQYYGKGQTGTLRILLGMGLRVSVLVACIFTALSFFIPRYLMLIYTNDPALIAAGAEYLRIMGWSFLFMGVSQIYECIIKSMNRAKVAAFFSLAALAVNIVLNAILIFGLCGMPKMGIAGAAAATVIARGVECLLCFLDSRKTREFYLIPSLLKEWNHVLFTDFRKYSLPALGNEFLWGAGFSCYTIVLGHMGSDIVAANSVVSAARNLCTVFVFGAAYGTAIIIGNEIGAGRELAARYDARDMLAVVFAASLLAGVILILVRPFILDITSLTPGAEYDLRIMLYINCVYILGMGMNTTFICGLFRAGGDSRFGLVLDTVAMWGIFVPLSFVAAFVLKLPALVVYTFICSDEFFKMPVNLIHYLKDNWVRNVTRDEAEFS